MGGGGVTNDHTSETRGVHMAGAFFSVAFDAFPHWGRVKDGTRPYQPIVCSTADGEAQAPMRYGTAKHSEHHGNSVVPNIAIVVVGVGGLPPHIFPVSSIP